jgi:hypothetical protein
MGMKNMTENRVHKSGVELWETIRKSVKTGVLRPNGHAINTLVSIELNALS